MLDWLELVSYCVVLVSILLLRFVRKSSELKVSSTPISNFRVGPLLRPRGGKSRSRTMSKQSSSQSAKSRNKPASPELSWRKPSEQMTRVVEAQVVESRDYANTLRLIESFSEDERIETECVYESRWYEYEETPVSPELPQSTDDTVSVDSDDERRRSYEKWSITDGEMFLQLGDYIICQIFVFGIEYHYCYKVTTKETTWDLPKGLEARAKSWFLVLPKSKRKKLGLHCPPEPLSRVPKITDISFHPWINTYC